MAFSGNWLRNARTWNCACWSCNRIFDVTVEHIWKRYLAKVRFCPFCGVASGEPNLDEYAEQKEASS